MLQYTPFVLAVTLLVAQTSWVQERGTPWQRHTINAGTRGVDGVRLADANGDGRLDICTAFEEGAQVKILLQPTQDKIKEPWPAVIVGREKNGEDAFLADVDGDGAMDVVSCHEGQTRSVFVHWAPADKTRYLESAAWKTEPFPQLRGKQMWMFGLPVDGGIVLGSKGGKSAKTNDGIGLLQPPRENRRDLSAWTWTPWSDAGWIMSIQPIDINRDGQLDVLVSDRYGPRAGIAWYVNPGKDKAVWPRHDVCKMEVQALFLTPATLEADRTDVLIASSKAILWYKLNGELRETIALPDWCGSGKAVSAGDLDGDQQPDLVFTCENAVGERSGIAWAKRGPAGWQFHDIGGPAGIKYDLCPLVDLDNDGDLDVVTTEEREGTQGGLGVVWYENPSK